MKNYFGFTHASSFPLHEGQLFYWSIMTAVDSIKCRWANSKHDGPSGQFLKSRGLSASVSFLSSSPLPALLLALFFAQYLTLVPRCLLLNCTEMLATQAMWNKTNVVKLVHVTQHKLVDTSNIIIWADYNVIVMRQTADHVNASFKAVCSTIENHVITQVPSATMFVIYAFQDEYPSTKWKRSVPSGCKRTNVVCSHYKDGKVHFFRTS